MRLGGHGNQSVGLRFLIPGVKASLPRVQTLSPLAMDRINMWIPRGKTLPAVDRLLPPRPSRHSGKEEAWQRQATERGKERERQRNGMDREEAKEEIRCSIACRTGTRDSFSGLGAASRAGSPSRSVSWLGSDDTRGEI